MTRDRIYADYLEDLLDALRKSRQFVAGMRFEQFSKDDKTVYAVIRALEVVGEAAKQIPHDVQQRHREVPWQEMAGMRDKLIHHYFGVDLKVVWKTVEEDVPSLIPIIRDVIVEEEAPG
jgi:uncharacterized protein with HEPN domain